MASNSQDKTLALLEQIHVTLQNLRNENAYLLSAVETLNGRVDVLAGVHQVQDIIAPKHGQDHAGEKSSTANSHVHDPTRPSSVSPYLALPDKSADMKGTSQTLPPMQKPSTTSRIILTTYPRQSGIEPVVMEWGLSDPAQRGPVVVSRHKNTIRRRNGMIAFWHHL